MSVEQLGLFGRASLNTTTRLKDAMRVALKDCGLSRDQVVDEMNSLADREGITPAGRAKQVATVEMLDKWVSTADNIIPLKLLPVFCHVTKSVAPLAALAEPLRARVIGYEDVLLLTWAETEKKSRLLRKQKRQLEMEIGI